MTSLAIVDSGPLLATVNRADPHHEACLDVLRAPEYDFVIPALCVAEVSYLLGSRKGAEVEAAFLRGLESFDVQAPAPDGWPRIAELVQRFADLPLGGTDASVLELAERLSADAIVTLDRRHFAVARPEHAEVVLLPEL